jgi:hypothetical protein
MRRYTTYYKNDEWMYIVYKAEDGEAYVLVATVPAIMWWDLAMVLSAEEVATLAQSKERFTLLVNQFLAGREWPTYKERRIESRIRPLGPDAIEVVDPPPGAS